MVVFNAGGMDLQGKSATGRLPGNSLIEIHNPNYNTLA
jgi:hypothetical protein